MGIVLAGAMPMAVSPIVYVVREPIVITPARLF